MSEREELFARGLDLIDRWCAANGVEAPRVDAKAGDPGSFGTCAYYRDGMIYIAIERCSGIGRAGRQWSYPGYVVDRTPYGVLAHELGHHVDGAHGPRGGTLSHEWRAETGEAAITGYADNDNEWFAEMFRLFVTNPDLLIRLRPQMMARLWMRWQARAESRPWDEVLADSPRHLKAARNKVGKVAKELARRIIA